MTNRLTRLRLRWHSLQGRLLFGTLALLSAGLLVADTAAYVALSNFLNDRLDRTLTSLTNRIREQVTQRPDASFNWATLGALLPSAHYVAVIGANGQIALAQPAVSGGEPLSPPALPVPLTSADDRLITVPSTGGDTDYRLSVITLPSAPATGPTITADGVQIRPATVILGASLADNDATLRRLLLVEIGSTAAILIAGAAAATTVLDRGLRPLRTVADTARAIARGRRDERIPVPQPQTEIGHVATALNAAFDERSKAEDQIRRFVADASHELRTPLTTIRGWADHYLDGGITDWKQTDTAMERIHDEATRMQRLVEDLLLLAQLDAHRPLDRRPTDIAALAEGLVADLRTIDGTRDITFTAVSPTPIVMGDEAKLLQVLRNLFSNALRHTASGSPIEITVGAAEHHKQAAVSVSVRDYGPGMDVEDRERAFDRFWRADTSRSAHGGHGLGLSIAREIAEAHGGTITFESVEGDGAEVRLMLPTCPVAGI